jgi:hypothetical protein
MYDDVVIFDEVPRASPYFEQWLARLRPVQVARFTDFVVSPGKPDESWLRER